MEIKGVILEINDIVQVSDTFKKREFILEYAENPQYPEFIKLETIQDKTELLSSLKVGDSITVHFNLKGRKWTNKDGVVSYFNSLQAWKIEEGSQNANDTKMQNPEDQDFIKQNEDTTDDLPF